MKFYCVIFATLLAVLSASADSAESKDFLQAFIVEQGKLCLKETNAPQKELDEMLEGASATTKTAKCLHTCVIRKLGVINDANKLTPENLGKLIVDNDLKSKDGKPLESIMKPISEACKLITDPDPCEAGVKILACLNAEAVKLGFDKNPF